MPEVLSDLRPATQGVQIAGMACIPFLAGNSTLTLTNAAAAENWLAANARYLTAADLTHYEQAKLVVRRSTGAAATGFRIGVKYATTDQGATYTSGNFAALTSPALENNVEPVSASSDSGWQNLVAGAKANVFLACYMTGGNGTADPIVGGVWLYLR